jgi:hypothetical protein
MKDYIITYDSSAEQDEAAWANDKWLEEFEETFPDYDFSIKNDEDDTNTYTKPTEITFSAIASGSQPSFADMCSGGGTISNIFAVGLLSLKVSNFLFPEATENFSRKINHKFSEFIGKDVL